MDLFALKAEVTNSKVKPVRITLVGPYIEEIPEEGLLNLQAVAAAKELLDEVPSNVVLMVPPSLHSALRLVAEQGHLFDTVLVQVTGIPGAQYSADFEGALWSCERVSYHSLVNDLAEVSRRADELGEANKTEYEKGRAQFERKDGSVKEHVRFETEDSRLEAHDVLGKVPGATAGRPSSNQVNQLSSKTHATVKQGRSPDSVDDEGDWERD